MAEYIDKHEAYLLLKDLEAAYIYPPVREAYGTAARRIDQIKPADVQPVNQWISVKDRLPEKDGNYLCYLECGAVCEATFDSTIASEGEEFPFGEWVAVYNSDTLGFTDSYWEEYDAITHWTPLPEPPQD